ncbi:enoyl-CoA hydratase-related protein [Sphingobium baderi]|uniref:Crotonase n=1 Tax=Sphingobium baderi LL03 TaxID=1114964 RepID=T0HU69_9SPHN|nr:enoyl-CoA hydratase-related protein [Sphingobium baderi]EQB01084.1 crotonase [Sphingobium baderi LL03]KMS60950.1 crotonase [Sphingobium baderi LL03]WRD76291.1 enoyl-CoA hydratase-related protein [Sphingobium baderi]
MALYEAIRIEHEEALSWIILNRPDAANALSPQLLEEFGQALEVLKHEGGPVIAIRGEGRGFCAGMDLGGYGGGDKGPADPMADRARLEANVARWLQMWDHPKPVIAAVHGYCMAAAAQMCVFSDITVVADNVKIGEPTIPIGGGFIAPAWVSLVGYKRAKEFAFVPGNWIDGPTAVEWGWANHCVPADDLIASVRSLAERIALTPPEVLRLKKLSINRAAEAQGFRQALSGIAEIDALLHLAPAVLEIRARMKDKGLKAMIQEYKVAPTSPLVAPKES